MATRRQASSWAPSPAGLGVESRSPAPGRFLLRIPLEVPRRLGPESTLSFAYGCPQNLAAEHGAATDPDVINAGLTVHTFETPSRGCGPIVRRYLTYVPPSLSNETRAPVLILLHGGPDRAENMRSIQTQRRFEVLAARHGFIVVYASAVPSKDSDPGVLNQGRWRTHGYVRPEVDDEVYLLRIVEDLLARRVIDGTNPVFLVGYAEGANMALQAAAYRPDLYSGVAAFMPYEMGPPFPQDVPGGAPLTGVVCRAGWIWDGGCEELGAGPWDSAGSGGYSCRIRASGPCRGGQRSCAQRGRRPARPATVP